MRVLDIDMDFFLDNIAERKPFDDTRLSDYEYTPWSEREVRQFLEKNCGLSKTDKTKGMIVKHHIGTLYYLRELYELDRLNVPIELVHIDAHADLGIWNNSYKYIYEELLSIDVNKRYRFEELDIPERSSISSGNYLLYLIAFGWIEKLTYVTHPKCNGDDYYQLIMENFNDNSGYIQLKYYPKGIKSISDMNNEEFIKQTRVKFDVIKKYENFMDTNDFDVCILSVSPSYTPKTADFIIDIFKDYINQDMEVIEHIKQKYKAADN